MLAWTECPDVPEIPASLPQVPKELVGTWWWAPAGTADFYVFVTGDGGPTPFCVTVYLLPAALALYGPESGADRGSGRLSRPDITHHPDRYPTLPELWEIADEFTLSGSLMAPSGPGGAPAIACSGSTPPESAEGDGTCFQMRQLGGLSGSVAETRYKLAAAGRVGLGDDGTHLWAGRPT